jgi:hypothetical protein
VTDFTMTAIGRVTSPRDEAIDDHWGQVEATITLDAALLGPDATAGLAEFSHVEVVFVFDRVDDAAVQTGARHPRSSRAGWPDSPTYLFGDPPDQPRAEGGASRGKHAELCAIPLREHTVHHGGVSTGRTAWAHWTPAVTPRGS